MSPMTAVALGSICWPDVVMWNWFQLLLRPSGSKITGSCTPPYKPPTIVENESIWMHFEDGFEARPGSKSNQNLSPARGCLSQTGKVCRGCMFKPNGSRLLVPCAYPTHREIFGKLHGQISLAKSCPRRCHLNTFWPFEGWGT